MFGRMSCAVCLLLAACLCFCTVSCAKGDEGKEAEDEAVVLNMNATYKLCETLPRGDGQRVKVILLLGQSNASGTDDSRRVGG